MPMAFRMGPEMTIVGAQHEFEHVQPSSLMMSSAMPSTAASTSGKYVGRHPAMTALTAIFSTVACPRSGGSSATTWSRGRSVPRHISATASSVGGTMGVPFVKPRA